MDFFLILILLLAFFAYKLLGPSNFSDSDSKDKLISNVFPEAKNLKYKHWWDHTAIAIDGLSKKIYLFNNGASKIYDFSDVREWRTNISTGGNIVGGMVMTGGLAGSMQNMRVLAENKRIKNENEAKSGLFLSVKDIDHALWHIKFKSDESIERELAKWMEILTQFLNEDKSDPDDELIENLSEWSCDREGPEFIAKISELPENLRVRIHQRYIQKNASKWGVFMERLDAVPEEDRTVELRRQIRKEVGQLGI